MSVVVSLFDGMSCAQIACERAEIPVTSYYASELDKYAIAVTQKNYPKTIQLGDVTKIDFHRLPRPKILVGGSPCQGFSTAGLGLNFKDPRSKLFFNYFTAKEQLNPEWFILENVRMKQEHQDVISNLLQVKPIMINSALLSAQNRIRLYWTNIPGITQPADRGLLLKDIINSGEPTRGKAFCLDANYYKGGNASGSSSQSNQRLVVNEYVDRDKSYCLDANYWKGGGADYMMKLYKKKAKRQIIFQINPDKSAGGKQPHMQDRIYSIEGKSVALTRGFANRLNIGHELTCRKLSVVECERLQTVPDGYTEGVSNSQRYKMLGNGFTVDVIAWILSHIPK